ncbi:MAG: pyridoxal phosphate-dependent aminotransferase [Parcubacteria group bacterium]
MAKKLDNRITKIAASQTIEVDTAAKKLIASGVKVYNFSCGEPDFAAPAFVRQSLVKAFNQGKTKYGASLGDPVLREEITRKLKRDNGLSYSIDNIAVTNGCKQALYNTFCTILNQGDEVIVYSPFWVSYTEQIKLAGGRARVVRTDKNLEPDIQRTRQAIGSRTKAVIINSANNPTGMVYSRQRLQELAKMFIQHDLYVITDDVYEKLVYDNTKFYSIAQFMKAAKKRVLVINGISKAYAMTGFRVGYVAADKEIISLMNRLQSHSTGNVCGVAQVAAEDVLRRGDEFVEQGRQIFQKRRDLVAGLLEQNKRIKFIKPQGAFISSLIFDRLVKIPPNFASSYSSKKK